MLPSRASSDDPFDELLDELREAGISTLGALKRLIDENIGLAEKRDQRAVTRFKVEGVPYGDELAIEKDGDMTMTADPKQIRRGVWKSRVGFVREILDHLGLSRASKLSI